MAGTVHCLTNGDAGRRVLESFYIGDLRPSAGSTETVQYKNDAAKGKFYEWRSFSEAIRCATAVNPEAVQMRTVVHLQAMNSIPLRPCIPVWVHGMLPRGTPGILIGNEGWL